MGSVADLARFRDSGDTEPRIDYPSELKQRESGVQSILCVDQSLNSSGVVFLGCVGDQVEVKFSITMRTETPPSDGHRGSLDRFLELLEMANDFLSGGDFYGKELDVLPDLMLIENPPVGNRMVRPESSLLAAAAWMASCDETEPPIQLVGAQRAKRAVCGNANAKKAEAHRELHDRYRLIPGFEQVSNEHERDALMLGIAYLKGMA